MKTFELIGYNSGASYGTIRAKNYKSAFNLALKNGYDVYTDYFLHDTSKGNPFAEGKRAIYPDAHIR